MQLAPIIAVLVLAFMVGKFLWDVRNVDPDAPLEERLKPNPLLTERANHKLESKKPKPKYKPKYKPKPKPKPKPQVKHNPFEGD